MDAFLQSELGREVPDDVRGLASIAVRAALEHVPRRDGGWDFPSLSYSALLAAPRISCGHPMLAELMVCFWGMYAQFLHDAGRLGEETLDRLRAELAAGADAYFQQELDRFLAQRLGDAEPAGHEAPRGRPAP
ncbi:MAG: hypothetical protein ACODAU_04815 [Myxococcota bacterium]